MIDSSTQKNVFENISFLNKMSSKSLRKSLNLELYFKSFCAILGDEEGSSTGGSVFEGAPFEEFT